MDKKTAIYGDFYPKTVEILLLIAHGKIDTPPLIIQGFKLEDIEEAYRVFEGKRDGAIKMECLLKSSFTN